MIIFRDILVHNIHVSIQEYQKKMKMFQKKVVKPAQQDAIWPPEVGYINIYHKTVKRMKVFDDITGEVTNEKFSETATDYEKSLE